MKIQCSCGAKFEFEVTPAMAKSPLRFVCPNCSRDASETVDALVRQQLGQSQPPAGEPLDLSPLTGGVTQTAAGRPKLAMRVEPAASLEPQAPAEESQPSNLCARHPGQTTVENCRVCGKPLCPECMRLFGYVCSPLCKAKAHSHGISVPLYEGQKSRREARLWRQLAWVSSGVGGLAALLLGFWFWYSWFGCVPKTVFSVRFPEMSYAGQSAFGGNKRDQIIFLHGNTLARYSLAPAKEIWSTPLLDHQQFARLADAQLKAMQERNVHLADQGVEDLPRLPAADKLTDEMERSAEDDLVLHVRGQNIWVAFPDRLVRYDWETGKPNKEISLPAGAGSLLARGDELLTMDADAARPALTHINLDTCDTRIEDLGGGSTNLPAPPTNGFPFPAASKASPAAGLPLGTPGRDMNRPMDSSRVAEQAQHLSLPQRLALPATLANQLSQERTLAALNEGAGTKPTHPQMNLPSSSRALFPTAAGVVELDERVLESRIIERSAAKPVPGKSVLDGNLTAGNSGEAANEMLNEIQRTRGGDVVQEDLSRYEVTLRHPGGDADWTGEVIGPPRFLPLKTVNVLAAGKTLMVFDGKNKKLWQGTLGFDLPNIEEVTEEQSPRLGAGPCVERDDSLYVFDRGFLACFELRTGNRRWGFPSVGISGLFFDDRGMLFVNTTSAGPEKIRYSRRIDLSQKTSSVVMKVDSRTGKILWTANDLGLVNYVSRKLILTVQSYQPDDEEGGPETGFETPPYLRIRRLDSRNGREIWEHFQQRCPLDIRFEGTDIRLVFRKEVQVLHFLML